MTTKAIVTSFIITLATTLIWALAIPVGTKADYCLLPVTVAVFLLASYSLRDTKVKVTK